MKLSSLGLAFSLFASIPFASAQRQSGAGQALPSQSIVDQAVGGAMLADTVGPALGVGVAGVGGAGAVILQRSLVGLREERTSLGRVVTIEPIPESMAGRVRPVTYPRITRDFPDLFYNNFGVPDPYREVVRGSFIQQNGRIRAADHPYLNTRSIVIVSNEVTKNLRSIPWHQLSGQSEHIKVSFSLTYQDGASISGILNMDTTLDRMHLDLLDISNRRNIVAIDNVRVTIPPATEMLPAMNLSQIRLHNSRIESAKLRLQALGHMTRGLRILQGVSIAAIPAGLVIALSQGASGQTLESCLSSNQSALCAEINALLNSEHLIAPTEQVSAVTEQITED